MATAMSFGSTHGAFLGGVIEVIDLISDDESVIQISDSESESGGNKYRLLPIEVNTRKLMQVKTEVPENQAVYSKPEEFEPIDVNTVKTEIPESPIIYSTVAAFEAPSSKNLNSHKRILSPFDQSTSPTEPAAKRLKFSVKSEPISPPNGVIMSPQPSCSSRNQEIVGQPPNNCKFPPLSKDILLRIINAHKQLALNHNTSTSAIIPAAETNSTFSANHVAKDECETNSTNSNLTIENDNALMNRNNLTPSPTRESDNMHFSDLTFDDRIPLSPEITSQTSRDAEFDECKQSNNTLYLPIRKSKPTCTNIFQKYAKIDSMIVKKEEEEEEEVEEEEDEIITYEDLAVCIELERIEEDDSTIEQQQEERIEDSDSAVYNEEERIDLAIVQQEERLEDSGSAVCKEEERIDLAIVQQEERIEDAGSAVCKEEERIDLPIVQQEQVRVIHNANLSLPFPCRCLNNFERNSSGIVFDACMENSLEAHPGVPHELDFTVKGMEMFTTKSLRPPTNLLAKLFVWTIESSTKYELNFRLSVLKHIHRLHGFPDDLLLWDYVEQAYNSDLLERTVFSLEVKACVLDFISFILEADLHSVELINNVSKNKSRAYKLLSARRNYGNLKTIVAWLEDTIKLYNDSNLDVSSIHFHLIIESLQKFLTFAVCASDNPLRTCNCLAEEIVLAHDRLQSQEQQRLLITGLKSNVLLMVTIETLLKQIPVVDNEIVCVSSWNWTEIIDYYCRTFSTTNMANWLKGDLLHYVFMFLMLVQTYIEGSRDQTHNMPKDCLRLINDEMHSLEARVEAIDNFKPLPEHVAFLFSLIKIALL